jgi:hypothetical protein
MAFERPSREYPQSIATERFCRGSAGLFVDNARRHAGSDRAMRANRPLNIEVHWVRDAGPSPIGAPNLVTSLTIGRSDWADRFEQRVRSQGFFEWHSWARKDTLSPDDWTVSVTGPNGQPVACGHDGQPCQFSIHVG